MLTHPTHEKLHALNLKGMLEAYEEQKRQSLPPELTFDDRLGLMLDRQIEEQNSRRLAARLKKAQLRQSAVVEDIDYRHPRDLDRSGFTAMFSCQWIKRCQNCIITGPTGTGKSYLACALSEKACREGYTALYTRMGRLMESLTIAKEEGRLLRKLDELARVDLLILDDWGVTPINAGQRRDLLEILEDRYERCSTLVTSQLPVEKWHEWIGDPTLADAILDRLVHNAHRFELSGESLRKTRAGSLAGSTERGA